jgi:hypothetical protein
MARGRLGHDGLGHDAAMAVASADRIGDRVGSGSLGDVGVGRHGPEAGLVGLSPVAGRRQRGGRAASAAAVDSASVSADGRRRPTTSGCGGLDRLGRHHADDVGRGFDDRGCRFDDHGLGGLGGRGPRLR